MSIVYLIGILKGDQGQQMCLLLILFAKYYQSMKSDHKSSGEQLSRGYLEYKEKTFPYSVQQQSQFSTMTAKRSTMQGFNLQPPSFQKAASQKVQDMHVPQATKDATIIHHKSIDNPEKIKHSFQSSKHSQLDYYAFVEKHHRDGKRASIGDGEGKPKDQLQLIKSKLEKYYEEMQRQDEMIVRKEKQIYECNLQLEQAREKISKQESQFQKLQNSYIQLHQQCLKYKQDEEYNEKLAQNYRLLTEKCTHLEHALEQKENIILCIKQAHKQELQSITTSKNQDIQGLQNRIHLLEHQNAKLAQTQFKFNQQMEASPTFQLLGQQFETKINFYLEETTKLKNMIGNYKGQVEELRTQKESLEATLKAYEERDRLQKASQLESEIILLREALEKEKMERDELVSRHELQILKLENQIDSKRNEEGTFITLYDQQRLRERLLQALQEVQQLTQQLSEEHSRLKSR